MRIEVFDTRTRELVDTIFVGTMTYSLRLLLQELEYPPDLTLQIASDSGKVYIYPPGQCLLCKERRII